MEENKPQVPEPVQTPAPAAAPSPVMPKKRTTWNAAWEFVRFAIVVVIVVVIVRVFIAQPFVVSGTSMVPTFQDSNYLIVDELTYRFHAPHRGDVIVFHPPTDMSMYYIKRVIGLPGDSVSIKNGVVSVTDAEYPKGKVLDESYITPDRPTDNYSVTVPDGQYFVMGDNRPASFDSRSWGLLPAKNITGRVFLRLLPFGEIGIFPGEHTVY